jgi:peptidoglycan/xylan/chitin deacetylase (PgdA/CDA1 family)
MNYSFPEKAMLCTRKLLNLFAFTKKVRGAIDKAVISFTFDDVPGCTFENAVPILDRYGVKATFYVSGGLCTGNSEKYLNHGQIIKLAENGHEIGCHTYSHIKAGSVGPKVFADNLDRNKQYFAGNFPSVPVNNFSYPNGSVGLWNKPLVNRVYSSARTTCYGINVVPVDSGFLLAYKLYSCKLDMADIDRLINQTRKLKGWLIFYTHDVCPKPSTNGCTPELFEYAVQRGVESGVEILNVRDALTKISTDSA